MQFSDITPQISEVASNYHYQRPPDFLVDLQEVVARFLRLLAEWLASLHIHLPGIADTRAVGNIMQFLLLASGLVCLTLIAWFVWRRVMLLKEQSELAGSGANHFEGILDSYGWKAQALKHAQSGAWKEACRSLYFAVLRLLDEKGVLEFAPFRTNYEYFYALSHNKLMQKDFRRLTDRVELIWFGKHQAGCDDYEYLVDTTGNLELHINAISGSLSNTNEGNR